MTDPTTTAQPDKETPPMTTTDEETTAPEDVLVQALEGEGIDGGIYCGTALDVLGLLQWREVREAMEDYCQQLDAEYRARMEAKR